MQVTADNVEKLGPGKLVFTAMVGSSYLDRGIMDLCSITKYQTPTGRRLPTDISIIQGITFLDGKTLCIRYEHHEVEFTASVLCKTPWWTSRKEAITALRTNMTRLCKETELYLSVLKIMIEETDALQQEKA